MKFELMVETAAFGSQYCDLACLIMFCVCVFFFFFFLFKSVYYVWLRVLQFNHIVYSFIRRVIV